MEASIYTYSVIRSATEAFAPLTPYVVAVLDEGGRKFTAFVEGYMDGQEILVGQKVSYSRMDEKGRKVYSFTA